MNKLFLLALLALSGAALAAPEDELLPADQAFQLTARVDGATIVASWKIAPGYYLYRDKFKFQALDPNLRLGAPQFPQAKIKEDPYFGRTPIYVNHVGVRVPLTIASRTGDSAQVRITAQGCNEPIGVCYPPIVKDVNVSLPIAAAITSNEKTTSSLRNFAQTLELTKESSEVVDPDKAFLVEAAAVEGPAVRVRFTIDDCCYLYRDKLRFSISAADGKPVVGNVQLGTYELPPGAVLTDEFYGRTQVYRRNVDLRLPLSVADTNTPDLLLRVGYQGCSEKGVKICYPPAARELPIHLTTAGQTGNAQARPPEGIGGFLWALLGAFAGGLLLTFTPCVLPMIPILSGVIVRTEGTPLTKLRGGLLSYTYVLGTAVTYAVAGAIAGATGEQLQAYFQNPWAIGIFAAVLVLLALSMFGLYELQMPASVQTLLHRHSAALHDKSRGRGIGEFVGVFLLGGISALIIGACVAPVLAFTLGTAIATRDPWLGAGIMFALAHGQGAILVAIGVSEGFLLPRAGAWMHTVKHIFGVLLIAVAIYLTGTLPQVPVLFLWSALLIVCAVYLGATQSLAKGASGWQYLQKGIGTFLLVWGIITLFGGFIGGRDVFNPLPLERMNMAFTGVASGRVADDSVFKAIRSVADLETELARAKDTGRPVILDYYATWCTDCVRMEASTFRDPQVRQTIAERFVALQVDVTTTEDPQVSALKRRFNVYGPPAMLFFAQDGKEQRSLRTYGYQSPAEFLAVLSKL